MIDAALSPNGRWFARGADSGRRGTVTLLDLNGGEPREYADVSFQAGGQRLAVLSNGEFFLSGSYHETGLVAYDTEDGDPLWERHDLKKLQSLAIDEREEVAWALFENRGARRIKLGDGRERSAPRGLRHVYISPDANRLILDSRSKVIFDDRDAGTSRKIELRAGPWLWNVAFAPSGVVLAWNGGPLDYMDERGDVVWTFDDVDELCHDFVVDRDHSGIWIVDRPFPEPPWYRIRLVRWDRTVARNLRTDIGAKWWLIREKNLIITKDLSIIELDGLESDS